MATIKTQPGTTTTTPVCTGAQTAASVTRYLAANGGAGAVAWWQPGMAVAPAQVLPPMPAMLAAMANGTGALFVRGQWGGAKRARGAINPRHAPPLRGRWQTVPVPGTGTAKRLAPLPVAA
jgi:hypothetical protein